MRKYLLDTPVLASYLLGRRAAREIAGQWILDREASTSMIVYGEVVDYIRGLADFADRYDRLNILLKGVYPHLITSVEAERYADIRRSLRRPYGPGLIGDIDTLIAATALEHDLILVSTDAHFLRVPGLRVLQVTLHS